MIINSTTTILTIVLFGSTARSDADIYSDTDVCVICEKRKCSQKTVATLIKDKFKLVSDEIVIYNKSEFVNMLKYGSLFLWHLKLEGKVLYDSGFYERSLAVLAGYDHHSDEIEYHISILNDMCEAYDQFNVITELDLAIIFTFLRNSCMILSNLKGRHVFGRISVFQVARQEFPDFPVTYDVYEKLSMWKMVYERGIDLKQELPPAETFKEYLKLSYDVLNYAKSRIEAYIV